VTVVCNVYVVCVYVLPKRPVDPIPLPFTPINHPFFLPFSSPFSTTGGAGTCSIGGSNRSGGVGGGGGEWCHVLPSLRYLLCRWLCYLLYFLTNCVNWLVNACDDFMR
jgi:hypothetical protein